MKTIIAFSILLFTTITLQAQISQQQLQGKWQINTFINKQINEHEKKKTYTFTQDSLFHTSIRGNFKGAYKLNPKTGECLWYAIGAPQPVSFMLQHVNDSTLHLRQPDYNQTIVVMQKVKRYPTITNN